MESNNSVGKGKTLAIPKSDDVIFGRQAAPLFQLFNVIMKMKVIPADTYDFKISENNALITVPANSTNNAGSGVGPVWLP